MIIRDDLLSRSKWPDAIVKHYHLQGFIRADAEDLKRLGGDLAEYLIIVSGVVKGARTFEDVIKEMRA